LVPIRPTLFDQKLASTWFHRATSPIYRQSWDNERQNIIGTTETMRKKTKQKQNQTKPNQK